MGHEAQNKRMQEVRIPFKGEKFPCGHIAIGRIVCPICGNQEEKSPKISEFALVSSVLLQAAK